MDWGDVIYESFLEFGFFNYATIYQNILNYYYKTRKCFIIGEILQVRTATLLRQGMLFFCTVSS